MKLFWQVSLCCLLATGIGMAQRGGGGHIGGGGGISVGFPGFPGAPGRIGFGQPGFGINFNPGFPPNGVISNPNVSAPFGLGLPAGPLGFPNGLVFSNGRYFPSVFFPNNLAFPNNAFFNIENQRFGNEFWGGWGWGTGAALQLDPLSLPARGGNAWAAYAAPMTVAVPPAEPARPVMHEYDQSGKEVQPARSASGERNRSVIHEYDADGKEVTPAR